MPRTTHTLDETNPVDEHTIVVHNLIPTSTLRRIRALLDYEFPPKSEYSLSRVPTFAAWDDEWAPTALALTTSPVIIRVIGTLTSVHHSATEGELPTLRFELELLRTVDHEGMTRLLRKSQPRPKLKHPRAVRALLTSAFQSNLCAQVFNHVYDATKRLRPTNALASIGLSMLSIGDIVLTTCFCLQRPHSRGWAVQFEPISVYQLAVVSRDVDGF
ncbi:hypothetical protein OH77DRAFT_1414634 [Trametes cingulata]|nr:hypothetical protein OH77DRAFT_1414634 [Trametes cingulata]